MDGKDGAPRREARFFFDPATLRLGDEPSEEGTRLVWMIVSLVKSGEVAFARYANVCRRGETTFKRDVAKLRELGAEYGYELSRRRKGVVTLEAFEGLQRPEAARAAGAAATDALRAVVDALGDVLGRELAGRVDLGGSAADRFLRIAVPRPVAHTAVAETYTALREAWTNRARVRFRYPSRDGGAKRERTVEPYLTTYVAGRYYLVAFDVRPKSGGWRQFALDRIVGPIQRAGTFSRRPVPAEYRGEDAIGLFKTGPAAAVTIALSPAIAEAVIAREWQRSQRIVRARDGSATVAFDVHDLAEAVRWALGFGAQARVVAPPEAVRLARALALDIAAQHSVTEETRALA
jgi:predicted DNA-binding transcriptional regulator YafY